VGGLSRQLIGANCRSEAFEGCNQWLYLEEPDRFNQLVVAFLLE
jgi:hypothetical protein